MELLTDIKTDSVWYLYFHLAALIVYNTVEIPEWSYIKTTIKS